MVVAWGCELETGGQILFIMILGNANWGTRVTNETCYIKDELSPLR